MSTPSAALVRMMSPDGQIGDIPQQRQQEALSSGFKLAIPMTSPDGNPGYIPHDQVAAAQKSGFKSIYPQSDQSKPYHGFGASNLGSQAWQGAKQLAGGLYETGKDVLFPQGNTEGQRLSFLAHKYVLDPADAENKKAQTASSPLESVGHSVAAALPFVGPWAANLGEQAGTGDVGGALARGGTQMAAMQAAKPILGAVKTGAGAAREALRNAAYQELPTKGPQLVKGAARAGRAAGTLAGGGLGAATGIPGAGYGGGVAGFELGPTLLEKILGTPEPGSLQNPGPFSKLPARIKSPAPQPEPEAPLGSPENPGWYAKLPARIPQKAASLPKQQLPFLPGATPSNVPVGNAQLPAVSELSGTPTPFPEVKPKAQVTGSAAAPFEPLVFESPEEAAAHDFRMQNLKRQASAAGTYHAAQGAAGKRTNLQQRIQRKAGNEQ